MKVKKESEKLGLKLNIQKTKIMASSPIISWQIDGDIMETVRDFIWGGFKITADGDCSHEKHGFSSRHVWMWELDHKESWAPKNWCFWIAVLVKTLESPLDSKEIKPINPKGNHSWIFTGRTDAVTEAPIIWPPDAKNWFIAKDPDAGSDWRQEEKGMTEDEMVVWHHQLNGHESE